MQAQTQAPTTCLSMSPALAQALVEFRLMAAFRARSAAQQEALARWVDEDAEPDGQRERIADLLDHLAATAK